jgi:hypothetical protein
MDEFGTSIRHNDEATVKCAPFYYVPTGIMFSLIWLEKSLEMGGKLIKELYFIVKIAKCILIITDELTRDYVYGTKDEQLRQCKLIPYLYENLDDEDYYFDEDPTSQVEPDDNYFNVSYIKEKYLE